MQIIIKHFHYPDDLSSWSSAERDEFKDFRHEMGDILKDIVTLVGQSEALSVPYQIMGFKTKKKIYFFRKLFYSRDNNFQRKYKMARCGSSFFFC